MNGRRAFDRHHLPPSYQRVRSEEFRPCQETCIDRFSLGKVLAKVGRESIEGTNGELGRLFNFMTFLCPLYLCGRGVEIPRVY